jgi:hypothetical protein
VVVDDENEEDEEDDEVAEPEQDEVEEDANEMFKAPETDRVNIFVSGSREGVLGRVVTGEEGSECVSSGCVGVGVSSIK